MDADNGSVDHLDGAIMTFGEGVHDGIPNSSRSPANEAVVASRVRSESLRQIVPRCAGAKYREMPISTRRSFTLGTPPGLFGRKGLMADHSKSVSSYLMIRLRFGRLESYLSGGLQRGKIDADACG